MLTLERRLWRRVEKTDSCWLWHGAQRTNRGYGAIADRGVMRYVHRVSWELANGPIPQGLYVLHHCDNPPCVRPSHLFVGTQKDNQQDAIAKGRNDRTNKTHCPQGHEYSAANTYVYQGTYNGRFCKTCGEAQRRAYRENKRST